MTKLSFPHNSIVDNAVKIQIPAKRTYRYFSAICESLKLAETIGITRLNKTSLFNEQSCDITLSKLEIDFTSDDIFLQLYLEKQESLLENGWPLLFTDGSKDMNGTTSYAIVDFNKNIKCLKILPNYISVFAAKASVITKAISIHLTTINKTVICTDSLSILKSIKSIIKDLLIKHSSRLVTVDSRSQ